MSKFISAQTDSIFYIMAPMPLFENADPQISFGKYLSNKVNSEPIPDSIKGRVIIEFCVDSTGSVVEPKIIRGINATIDSLVYQVVLKSPKWTPGRMEGNNVNVYFTFPVSINSEPKDNNKKNYREKKKKRHPNKQ